MSDITIASDGSKSWKVYGPDLNGRFGGLQGTGGLEAVVLDAGGTTTGIINDQFGNGVATVTGTGSGASVTWNTTRVGAYGPLPGVQPAPMTDVSQLAAAMAWRSHRIDPTGFYWLGARYYEPTSGRFLSADPAGHAASPSLYDYAGGDPVNGMDPDGRCKNGPFKQIQDSIDNFGASQTDIFAGLNAVNRFNAQNSEPDSAGYRASVETIVGGSGPAVDEFPYANTTDADCGISAIRTAETLLLHKPARSRADIIALVGEPPGTWDDGGGGMTHVTANFNSALTDIGHQVTRTPVNDSAGFVSLISQGNLLVVARDGYPGHVMIVEPVAPDFTNVNVYNNGPRTHSGHAYVQTNVPATDILGLPRPQQPNGATRQIWVISPLPPPTSSGGKP